MSVYPNFLGGDPAKPWHNEPPPAAGEDAGSQGSTGGVAVGALEGASCCLDGCAGCAIAVLVAAFLTAGTAMAAAEWLK